MRSLKGKNITWYDIVKPNDEDLAEIVKVHPLHPIIVEELAHQSNRTRIEHYGDYLFLVYHFPEYDPVTKTSRRTELDFVITKNKIITVHYEPLKQLDGLFDYLGKDAKERARILSGDTLLGTYYIFERLIAFSLRQLRHIEEEVAKIGANIFTDREEELLRDISTIKRDIIDFRLITHSQEHFLNTLRELGERFWGKKSEIYMNDLVNDNQPVHRNIENYYETIESLESTNGQLLDAKTNRIIKRFTVGAFLFSIPLYFVFYSEFSYIHAIFAATPLAFWTSFVVIHSVVITLWFVFKKRKII